MNENYPHTLPKEAQLKKVLKTKIATIYFYKHVVVVEAIEGTTLSYKTGFAILLKALQIAKFKPCVYISHRINSYAVNPNDYKYLNKIPSLKGIAIVSQLPSAQKNAALEQAFCKKEFGFFSDMNDAYTWALELLGES